MFAHTASPAYLRNRKQILALSANHPLVEPGLVDATAGIPLLHALTGRAPLPTDFSAV